MGLWQLATGVPAGATTSTLRVRGHTVHVVTPSQQAAAILMDTFYPVGIFGTEISAGRADDHAELTVVDRVCEEGEISDYLAAVAEDAVGKSDYELTRNFRLPRFDCDELSVFVLEDANDYEPAAVVRTAGRITILRPGSLLGDRWLTRIVRDVVTRYAKADGSLVLHSSAFVYGQRAYLVIGDSGAGKSTTAVALARLLRGAAWMGNDRMHLDRVDEHYRVTACPLPLAINKGSLDAMGITDYGAWSLHAGLPRRGSDWDQFMGEDKMKLSSREVERYLGVPVSALAPLAGVIFPQIDRDRPYSCGPADLAHAGAVIGRNCFSADDNLYGQDWLEIPVAHRSEPPSLASFLDHISGLLLLRCSVGSGAGVARLADQFAREAAP